MRETFLISERVVSEEAANRWRGWSSMSAECFMTASSSLNDENGVKVRAKVRKPVWSNMKR
jgi:hypothetical protein